MSLIKIENGGEATAVTCQVDRLPDVFHDSCKPSMISDLFVFHVLSCVTTSIAHRDQSGQMPTVLRLTEGI